METQARRFLTLYHINGQLYAPPSPHRGRDRPRKKGKELPNPAQVAADPQVKWRRLRLIIYEKKKVLQVKETSGLWRSAGFQWIKVVIVRDHSGKAGDQVFFTTDTRLSAGEILRGYSRRLAIEVAFQNVKSRLGFKDPQNRTRKAVECTAPLAMVLNSFVIDWFAEHGYKRCKFPNRPWYGRKATAAFADILVTLRSDSLREYFLNTPEWNRDNRKIIRLFTDPLRLAG